MQAFEVLAVRLAPLTVHQRFDANTTQGPSAAALALGALALAQARARTRARALPLNALFNASSSIRPARGKPMRYSAAIYISIYFTTQFSN